MVSGKMTSNDNNILPEEEYCHYSGLPSVQFYENIEKENMQEKESKTNWHFRVSVLKSVFRIMAGLSLCFGSLVVTGLLLIVAEVLGIIEEL
jgi:hypothetical protein